MTLSKIITEIEQLDAEQLSENYEKFECVFKEIPRMVAAPIKFPLATYRIRVAEGIIDDLIPSSFSYKPERLKPGINRLNLSGESVFYGSIFPQTPIRELDIKPNTEFYLSKWTIDKNANLSLYRLFTPKELVQNKRAAATISYVNSIRNDNTTTLLSMISNKLTSNISSRNEYNFTALYASYLRRNRNFCVKDEDGNEVRLRIDGFIYKSVKSTNPDELNLAFFRLYRYCPCLRGRTANQISGYSGRNNLDYLYLCDMAKKSNTSLAYETLLNIILPDGILEIFEVSNVREEHTGIIEETGLELRIIHIHLDERDLRVKEWHDLRPNGFTEEHCINDFPIRDRKVVLHVRRRRWLDDEGKNVILPHEGLTAPGTSYSKEFADVLKKIFGCLPDTGPLSGAVL